MLATYTLRAALVVATASLGFAQELTREELERIEYGGAASEARLQPLRASGASLSARGAAHLRKKLEADPLDLRTRLVLMFHELPEPRRERGARPDPRPHGELLLGLIEQHPRSNLACGAGLLLYPYKRDGMYTGPAWEAAIDLWEELVAAHPKDPAIACNAGAFLMADPFRFATDGARAQALLERARALAPKEPRWALKLGTFHSLSQRMTRDPEARAHQAAAGMIHLRAAWDLTAAEERGALEVMGEPLAMALALAYFDTGRAEDAEEFARRALAVLDADAPDGDVVYKMNALLGRLALAADDLEAARRYLLAAGKTSGSAVLGSFGPDLTLARELLARGERATVLEFLELCQVFWGSGAERLEAWIAAIDKGENPWKDER